MNDAEEVSLQHSLLYIRSPENLHNSHHPLTAPLFPFCVFWQWGLWYYK